MEVVVLTLKDRGWVFFKYIFTQLFQMSTPFNSFPPKKQHMTTSPVSLMTCLDTSVYIV